MNEPPRGEEPEGQAERGDFKRREVAASATGARRVRRVNVTPLAGPKRGLGLRSREPHTTGSKCDETCKESTPWFGRENSL